MLQSINADCPPNSKKIDGKCYVLITDWPKTFNDANTECETRGGKLFEPQTVELNDEIRRFVRPDYSYWIGINDQGVELPWANTDNCIRVTAQEWISVSCEADDLYKWAWTVCELPDNCPEGSASLIPNRCFFPGNDDWARDYDGSVKRCQDKGGKLFEPQSQKENNIVRQYAIEELGGVHVNYWIGINDKAVINKWAFDSTSTPANFDFPWHDNQPSKNDNERCIINDNQPSPTSKWAARDCSKVFRSVCEFSCPEGWTLLRGSCYLFNNANVDINEAGVFCEEFGAKVVEPKSAEEDQAIFKALDKSVCAEAETKGCYKYWIGAVGSDVEK